MPPRPLTINETLARVIPRRWDYWRGAVSLYIAMDRARFPNPVFALEDYKNAHEQIVTELLARHHVTVMRLTQRDLDNPIWSPEERLDRVGSYIQKRHIHTPRKEITDARRTHGSNR